MQPLIVSYSGIRGVVGESLTEDVALRFGRAFGRLVTARHPAPTFLVGRDTRPSGAALVRAAMRGLAPFGRLVDLGVVATPTLQFAMGAFAAEAALCVTASHNTSEWNGLKLFLGPDNTVLDGEQMRELRARAEVGEVSTAAPPLSATGPTAGAEERHGEAIRRHVEAVRGRIDAARVQARRFRVALDSAGGAGQEATEALLAALGCAVVPVASGRESEPVAEHLGALCRAVVEERCDLGLAQDLDGDRLALVTERGIAPGEEATLVLAVDHLLRRHSSGRRVVVKNVSTSRAVDDVALRHGATLVETPVGEVNLSRALLRETRLGHLAFGGEGNGGVIFPPISAGRDSLVGTALVLESLAVEGVPLSQRLAALPRYHGRKLRAVLAARDSLALLLPRIEAAFPGGEPIRLDGLKLRFPDGSWFLVRASNTEPIVRVVAESMDPAWVDETTRRIEGILRAAGGDPA
jgi:phosphomannomutase